MKAFDKIGDNLKPDEEFNKQSEQIDKKIIDQKQSIEKEQEETNKGLKIEMRNQTMCPIMRVEFPNEIVEEIKDEANNILSIQLFSHIFIAFNVPKMFSLISNSGIENDLGPEAMFFHPDSGEDFEIWAVCIM